jgi:hypothetical protein
MAFVQTPEKIADIAYHFFTFLNYYPKVDFYALVDECNPGPSSLTDLLVDLLLLEGVQYVPRE